MPSPYEIDAPPEEILDPPELIFGVVVYRIIIAL